LKREIVIATRNRKKLKELKRLFKGARIKIASLDSFPEAPEVIEDRGTFKGNAIKKAAVVSKRIRRLVIADDSGLEVDALGGKPGVHSARYAGPSQTDTRNIEKLLRALKGTPLPKRIARFKCAIAVCDSGKVVGTVEGVCEGRIAFRAQGGKGFGYDPVFVPRGYKSTFGKLSSATKDRSSHRAKALKKAKDVIERYFSGAL
jgi:XTP/dITP diphosphohydrolase